MDPIASVEESDTTDEVFDRAIWKDKQEILQTFEMSEPLLKNWRKDGKIRMRKYNKKYFYHIKDAEALFQQKHKKKEWYYKWPISWPWTVFWPVAGLVLLMPANSFEKLFSLSVLLLIAVPSDIIIRLRKRRQKK